MINLELESPSPDQNIIQNQIFSFFVPQKKVSHKGLEQYEGK